MIVEARRDVITLRGSLLEDQWPTIQAAARVLLEEHPEGIIIDCSQLTEVTEAGAKTFLDAIRYIQQYDARIIVAGVPDEALGVIKSVRAVMSQLPIAPNVDAARASLGLEDLTTKVRPSGLAMTAVLLVGDWQRAAGIACKMCDRKRDEMHLVYLLRVPRAMPLATPLPEQEAMARRMLEDGERIARSCKLNVVRHVERVRSVGEGVQRILTLLHPRTLVICIAHQDEEAHEITSQVIPNLLSDPPCEIVYVRKPG